MGITTSKDIGPGADRPVRYLQNRDPDATVEDHPLETALPAVSGEDAGIPGGLTDGMREAEAQRVKDAPVVGRVGDGPPRVEDPSGHEVDVSGLGEWEVPRHDRYAAENSEVPNPARVVPSTPTNANPSFADYAVPVQDRPGFADGTDAVNVAEALGEVEVDTVSREDVPAPEVDHAYPDGPLAGEGAFETRETTVDATGVTSPIGDAHNDPNSGRVADTYEEAKEHFEAVNAEKDAQVIDADNGDPSVSVQARAADSEGRDTTADDNDADATDTSVDPEGSVGDRPSGNATVEEWRAYAVAQGMAEEEAAQFGRNELRELYP